LPPTKASSRAPLQSTITVMIAAIIATQTPTNAKTPTTERSVAALKIAPSDPKTKTIQIKFLKNSVPARFRSCQEERMAISSFIPGADIVLVATSQE
jgi:hypothetical protein